MSDSIHKPVLLNEVLEAFKDCILKNFVDGTLGMGGHAERLLNTHPELECYLGCDQDINALSLAKERLINWKEKIKFSHGNFSNLFEQIQDNSQDGILIDLGVSSLQLDSPERGFSFLKSGPLDMRMNPLGSLTAADIVNFWSEDELGRILRDYGEERYWRKIARLLVQKRKEEPFVTTDQLVSFLDPFLRSYGPFQKIHPLTRSFQALRIAVNQELEVLEKFLPIAINFLKPKGRLAVISFHSLEDRIVKHAFQQACSDKVSSSGLSGLFIDKKPLGRLLYRKARIPSEEEIFLNPRSRSAKLRVFERT